MSSSHTKDQDNSVLKAKQNAHSSYGKERIVIHWINVLLAMIQLSNLTLEVADQSVSMVYQ
jgi:cytochrome b561